MKRKESRSEIEEKINLRAWEDPKFKAKLLSKPVEALKELGFPVPPHAKVYVHEEDEASWHLVLRRKSPSLSEEEMKKIAAAGESLGNPRGNCY